jgi:putative hydrolase of the HAD superfamily
MPPFRALLLDVDNTLVDRAGAYEGYADRLLAAAGADPARRDELIAIDAGCYTPRPQWAARTLAALPGLGWSPERLVDDFERFIVAALSTPAPALPWLKRLSPVVRLVGCTNGPSHLQRGKIVGAGLDAVLDGAAVSGEVGQRKPAAAMFEAALAIAGCAPAEAVMVGDNPEHDVQGAAAAGLRTAWVSGAWERFGDPVAVEPDWRGRTIAEVFEALCAAAGV